GSRQRPGVRRRAQRRGAFDDVGRNEVRGLGKAVVAGTPDAVSDLAEGFSRRGDGRDSVLECAAERSGAALSMTWEGTGCVDWERPWSRDPGRGSGHRGGVLGAGENGAAGSRALQEAQARRVRGRGQERRGGERRGG